MPTLTNSNKPWKTLSDDPDAVAIRLTLVDATLRNVLPVVFVNSTRMGSTDVIESDFGADGVFALPGLPVTEGSTPESHFLVDVWRAGPEADQRYHEQFIGDIPAGVDPVQWEDFYIPGTPGNGTEWSAFTLHATAAGAAIPAARHLSADERAALDGANAPNGANPLATIADVTGGGLPTGQADEDLLAGQPLRLLATGHLALAAADTPGHGEVVGLCGADTVTGNGAPYSRGQVTRADWTSIIGTPTLTPGALYYLDPATAGTLTTSAPDATGHYLVRGGRAVDTDTLQAAIEPPVLL